MGEPVAGEGRRRLRRPASPGGEALSAQAAGTLGGCSLAAFRSPHPAAAVPASGTRPEAAFPPTQPSCPNGGPGCWWERRRGAQGQEPRAWVTGCLCVCGGGKAPSSWRHQAGLWRTVPTRPSLGRWGGERFGSKSLPRLLPRKPHACPPCLDRGPGRRRSRRQLQGRWRGEAPGPPSSQTRVMGLGRSVGRSVPGAILAVPPPPPPLPRGGGCPLAPSSPARLPRGALCADSEAHTPTVWGLLQVCDPLNKMHTVFEKFYLKTWGHNRGSRMETGILLLRVLRPEPGLGSGCSFPGSPPTPPPARGLPREGCTHPGPPSQALTPPPLPASCV